MSTLLPEVRSFFHAKANAVGSPPISPAVLLKALEVDHGDEIHIRSPKGNRNNRACRRAVRHIALQRCRRKSKPVADFDGVIIEPISKFLEETFGVIWPPLDAEREATNEFQKNWPRLRVVCRENGGVLLTASGLADGELVPDEVGAILDFVRQCCVRSKLEFSEKEDDRLRLYIRRLRPTTELIDRALDRMASRTLGGRTNFVCVRPSHGGRRQHSSSRNQDA